MSAGRLLLAAAGLAGVLLLPACAQTPMNSAPPSPAEPCDAARLRDVLGQPASDALAESARQQAGAETVRIVRHDQLVTKEYRVGRLTLWLDANGRVRNASCG